jgi:hypothetical protein
MLLWLVLKPFTFLSSLIQENIGRVDSLIIFYNLLNISSVEANIMFFYIYLLFIYVILGINKCLQLLINICFVVINVLKRVKKLMT